MEDLQKAISILYNPKQFYSNQTKQEAELYCNKIIADHKTDYAFFLNLLEIFQDLYVQYWLLSALEVIIRQYYSNYAIENRKTLHEYYFTFLEQKPGIVFSNSQLMHKYSFIFTLLVRTDYPEYWPDAFDKLLALQNTENSMKDLNIKLAYFDFILTTLVDFDREIVDLYEAKSAEERTRGKIIKEEMRKRVINDITGFLNNIIQNYSGFKEHNSAHLVVKALDIASQIIDWASLDLFLGNLHIFVQFLGIPQLQTNSAKCIYSIIDKGMDPKKKLDMFDSLGLLHILGQWNPVLSVSSGSEEEFGKNVFFTLIKPCKDGGNNK